MTVEHLFFKCNFAESLWTAIRYQLKLFGRSCSLANLWTVWSVRKKYLDLVHWNEFHNNLNQS